MVRHERCVDGYSQSIVKVENEIPCQELKEFLAHEASEQSICNYLLISKWIVCMVMRNHKSLIAMFMFFRNYDFITNGDYCAIDFHERGTITSRENGRIPRGKVKFISISERKLM